MIFSIVCFFLLKNPSLAPGDHTFEITHQGAKRSYLVHVPPALDPKTPATVILAFHGFAMPAPLMPGFTGLSRLADTQRFLAVYPFGAGTPPRWSVGSRQFSPTDDVGFVAALLDDLAARTPIDPKRVYATGMSNGGMMCYRLAAELSDRIAAIAPVGGTMTIPPAPDRTARPVPVLHFHGTKDRFVPYNGPDAQTPKFLPFHSVDQTIAAWVQANGCPDTPTRTTIPDRHEDDTSVEQVIYAPGRAGAEVILYRIEGGGHTWPGHTPASRFLGPSTREIDASQLLWEFFQKHPMK
jgi:polyhydroxybutyrate depolymerase